MSPETFVALEAGLEFALTVLLFAGAVVVGLGGWE
jgi:hypothetical protein